MAVHLDLRALHSKGDGPAQDFTKALECYLKNRQQGGHANALFCVGDLFLKGQGGVSQDSAVAAKWFLKASNEGHDFCQVKKTMKKIAARVDLNALHNQGDGPPEDFPKALECYLKNLPEGQAHAFFRVGQIFFKGRGVSRNMSVAGNWFLEAANQGHALAQSNIGVMYELGRGVPRDSSRAMEWYLQAAKGGHVESKARYEYLTQVICKT
jgi:TPR repeat protein